MHRSLVAFILTLGVAQASGAVTITASASAGLQGNPTTVVGGPATSGQVSAAVAIPLPFRNLAASSALDVDGNAALNLNGLYWTAGEPHLAGNNFPQVTDAATTWTSTLTNDSAVPRPYVYAFVLSPFRLANFDNGLPATDPLANIVSFAVEVRANGNLVFQSSAQLRGARNPVLTETGTDLGGVFGSNEFEVFYDFSQHTGRIPLGSVAPGESITVEAKLIAHAEAMFDGSGGFVTMGDPLDLKGDPGVSAVTFGEDQTVGVAPVSWAAAKRLYR